MLTKFVVRPQSYQDSLKLMAVSAELKAMPDIDMAAAVMGTDSNRATLMQGGFELGDSLVAGPEDIIIAVRSHSEAAIDRALNTLNKLLQAPPASGGTHAPRRPRALMSAVNQLRGANLALISVPGDYAAAEAFKALRAGLNVMIFSDNVSVDDEVALKKLAKQKDLFVMGPDCGTAIINNTPLCFANAVAQGPIGIVGAAGTGIQQVSVLIDQLGSGISQAIGTGGRDLSDAVGGVTMLMGLDALEQDENTKVIVVISKPPGAETTKKVLRRIADSKKPVVIAFSGGSADMPVPAGAYAVPNLEEAAAKAVALVHDQDPCEVKVAFSRAGVADVIKQETPKLSRGQVHVRGLFSGGSLTSEAINILKPMLGAVQSNIAKEPHLLMKNVLQSEGHCVIDLGGDDFTKGRPHPMIDPSYRAARLLQEYGDPTTAVILCDVVIGYGAHPNPAGAIADAVDQARGKFGHYVTVVASVCGTNADPQKLARQTELLHQAGVVVAPSNAFAAELAGQLALECQGRRT